MSLPSYAQFVSALVLVWGLGDVASTFAAASVAGPGMEANPWIRVMLGEVPLLVVLLKAAVVTVAGIALLECRSVVERVPGWQVWFAGVVGVGLLVTANNVAVVFVALF